MRRRVFAALALIFVCVCSSVAFAGDWDVSLRGSKLLWPSGEAQAHSDVAPGVSLGYLPSDRLRFRLEGLRSTSSFGGFRPPGGEMKSTLLSLGVQPRWRLSEHVVGFGTVGASHVTHDRDLAADDTAFDIGFGGEVTTRGGVFGSLEGRFLSWLGSSDADLGNPRFMISAGVGMRF